jgi:pentatricopeptide repeat protein
MRGASSAASRRGTYPGAPPPTRPGAALTHAYDALLRALHVSGRGEEVERAFAEMTDGGARRTVHTYNSLIASHEARRQWQRAGDAMARMQEEGIAPDAITFDALIDVAEETGQWDRATAWLEQAQEEGHLRCEDELGVLDLHRIRSAGTAQTVLRWWLRRMRARALAPLDAAAAGRGTRAILEKTAGVASGSNGTNASLPAQIRDLPEQIQVVTGWGKHSTVFGHSPVKERVLALLGGLNSPFDVPDHNIGCVVADRGDVRAWLVRDELLSLVRFLGGNRDALKRNFNPKSAGIKR